MPSPLKPRPAAPASRRTPPSPRPGPQAGLPTPHTSRPTLWILEDQLSARLPDLAAPNGDCHIFMVESDRNFRSVPFHKHRIAFLVSAMRHFADELRAAGKDVRYYPFAPQNYRDSLSALRDHIRHTGSTHFYVVEPSEYHTRQWMETLPDRLGIRLTFLPNPLFLTDRTEFADWAGALKAPLMETFYRRMRKSHGVLMEDDGETPLGGTWNFDKDNRKRPKPGLLVPDVPAFPPDRITAEVLAEIERRFPDHPGRTAGFRLPVTREDARTALSHFCRTRLPLFGDYEDAMVTGQPVLFHSFLSPLINCGLLEPLECVRLAEKHHAAGKVPLNAAEGFIRQILGWREYVYGIYWTFMPGYRARNTRNDQRTLPGFFWTGDTDLNCLRQTLGSVIGHAYSHHIQRLMVICNFATLCGLSPQAVNDWFYSMYVDSHDWVVTPNVIGMGMCADGTADAPHRGTMATKPYISSAAYIDRMSDYCADCRYNPKARTGDNACPFNYLFWTFLDRYKSLYASNPRMTMMLANLKKIPPAELREMNAAREKFLSSLGTRG